MLSSRNKEILKAVFALIVIIVVMSVIKAVRENYVQSINNRQMNEWREKNPGVLENMAASAAASERFHGAWKFRDDTGSDSTVTFYPAGSGTIQPSASNLQLTFKWESKGNNVVTMSEVQGKVFSFSFEYQSDGTLAVSMLEDKTAEPHGNHWAMPLDYRKAHRMHLLIIFILVIVAIAYVFGKKTAQVVFWVGITPFLILGLLFVALVVYIFFNMKTP